MKLPFLPHLRSALFLLAACGGRASAAGDAEVPQVDVRCGVSYSLSAQTSFGPWPGAFRNALGEGWTHILQLTYAPFVVVTNNTGWPLILNGGSNIHPQISFDQPPLGLTFRRIGDNHPGSVTYAPVALDQMYISVTGSKTFNFSLYAGDTAPAGFETLAAGERRVFAPYIPPTAVYDTVLDWRNNLTANLMALPGWKGPTAGFCVDYLAGSTGGVAPAVNANLSVIPTRVEDSWDVTISRTASLNGCRVFRNFSPRSATWPWDPDAAAEVGTFPFKITDFEPAIQASAMFANSVQPVSTWPVQPLFSVLLPPQSLSGFVTDKNRNGINDEWEKFYFGELSSDPDLDPDQDGFSNYFEFLAGTSPVDGTDFMTQTITKLPDGGLDFEWSSVVNRSYLVETSGDLSVWSASDTITATATTCHHALATPESGCLYARVRILPVK